MKNVFISLVFFCLCIACVDFKKKDPECYNLLIPKENIQVYLDSFVRENRNDSYIYELYIDKLDPENYNLLLFAGKKSFTCDENRNLNQSSLNRTIVSGVEIKIYSGIEHYFDQSIKQNSFPQCNDIGEDRILWAIRDSLGTLSSYQIDGGYPFFPFPLKNEPDMFTPPVIKEN